MCGAFVVHTQYGGARVLCWYFFYGLSGLAQRCRDAVRGVCVILLCTARGVFCVSRVSRMVFDVCDGASIVLVRSCLRYEK